MRIKLATVATIACGGLLLMGCTARESAAPPPPASTPSTAAAPAAPPVAPVSSAPATQPPPQAPEPKPAGQAPAATSPSPAPLTSAPPSPRSSPPSPPVPVVSAPAVVDPGGPIAALTKPGLRRVGARKCGVCHKLQLASWTESAHAKRRPPLDCESCHGPGSEYNSLATMKDSAKAKAAGLVRPNATFCATCHKHGWRDDQLRRVHAHKAPSGS